MRHPVPALLVPVLAAALLVPRTARAGARTDLTTARSQYQKLEFTQALKTYQRVAGAADATPTELARAYLGEGFCLVALGRDADARRALKRAFVVNPTLAVSKDLSPKLLSVIEAARREAGAGTASLKAGPDGSSLAPQVAVKVRDPRHRVTGVVVHFRSGRKEAWRKVTALQVGVHAWSATLPEGGALELWIAAVNRYGLAAARLGSKSSPYPMTLPGHHAAKVAAAHPAAGKKAAPAAAKETAKAKAPPAPGKQAAPTPAKEMAKAKAPPAPGKQATPPPAKEMAKAKAPPVPGKKAAPTAAVAAAHPAHATVTPPAPGISNPYRPWAYTTAGAAVVAAGAGIYFIAQSYALANKVNNGDPSQFKDQNQAIATAAAANRDGPVGTALVIGGGVLAAASVGLFLLHPPAATAHGGDGGDAFSLSGAPTPGGAMVLVSGRLPF